VDEPGRPADALSVPGADLHTHSTASDGTHSPADLVRLAAAAGLDTIALTDHDTLDGVTQARGAGEALGVRVIAGCEFSVQAPWGEMHLLGYFLPLGQGALAEFLAGQRAARADRMREIVRRLRASGAAVTFEAVRTEAGGEALGRPHAARALIRAGHVAGISEAFDRFLGRGRPAFVPKRLPELEEVTALVRRVAGVTSAAHLKGRATRAALERLKEAGVDAVEVRHPAHDAELATRLEVLAPELGMLRSGGTDWHGEEESAEDGRAPLGAITIPAAWVVALEALHRERERESGEGK
jgi:predicted metal-dependent phosphoesterase TrpH